MNTLETILLGIVQGLTEFLPVSSSGHLVIGKHLLGFREPELLVDIVLHCGTLLAVCVFFRSNLREMIEDLLHLLKRGGDNRPVPGPHALLAFMVVIGSIPTGLIGLFFKDSLEALFASPTTVGAMLVVTGAIVGSTRFIPPGYARKGRVSIPIALAIGVAQGIAIIPGISRSGATIVCGLLLGLNRDLAGRFSFILSIPAILGALILEMDTTAMSRVGPAPLIAGFLTSAVVGLLALKVLMTIVRKGRFYYFAPYCWAIGILTLWAL